MSTIVLDLETKKTFQEVGGARNMPALGVSLLGVYFYDTDLFHAFREEELSEFEQFVLDNNPTVIGFNSVHFDLPVLQPYYRRAKLSALPHVDILKDVQKALGVRLKLETIAQATLCEGKSGHGLDAIRYYRNGEWDKLEKYCLDDVRITRDIYEYGKRHGRIYYENHSELRPISVQWSTESPISERLQSAAREHRQVTLEVIEPQTTGRPTRESFTADIRDVQSDRILAFIPDRHEERFIPMSRIMNIKEQETTSMHQASLL